MLKERLVTLAELLLVFSFSGLLIHAIITNNSTYFGIFVLIGGAILFIALASVLLYLIANYIYRAVIFVVTGNDI